MLRQSKAQYFKLTNNIFNYFLLFNSITFLHLSKQYDMAKKKPVGRPKGKPKKFVGVYLENERVTALKDLSETTKVSQSDLVGTALDKQYGI